MLDTLDTLEPKWLRCDNQLKSINMLTIIGHRFDHQSGLDDNPGGNSTTFLNGTAIRVYFIMFSKIIENSKYSKLFTTTVISKKHMSVKENACGKPETP